MLHSDLACCWQNFRSHPTVDDFRFVIQDKRLSKSNNCKTRKKFQTRENVINDDDDSFIFLTFSSRGQEENRKKKIKALFKHDFFGYVRHHVTAVEETIRINSPHLLQLAEAGAFAQR